jgi:hypothetical protein
MRVLDGPSHRPQAASHYVSAVCVYLGRASEGPARLRFRYTAYVAIGIGRIAVRRSILSERPSALMNAGHSGQRERIVRSHCSNIARNRLGREYSTQPSCWVSPNGPNNGMTSGPFATKQR